MATTITTPTMPTVGGSDGTWGTTVNSAVTTLVANDTALQTTADAALPKAGGTMTGNVNLVTATTARTDSGSVSGTQTVNLSVGQVWTMTIAGDTTFGKPTNVPSGTNVIGLIFVLTNAGAHTITWNSVFGFAGGTKPTLTASGIDVIGFLSVDNGTSWRCCGVQKDVK